MNLAKSDFQMVRRTDYDRLLNDSIRWRKLRKLCGYLANGSEETVVISQDDATHTAHIKVGNKSYFAYNKASIEATLDSIPEPEE